jgi:hypothetical protein
MKVEAETKEEAREKAFNNASLDDLDDWETLDSVNTGNVCHFPTPWEIDIQEM